MTEKPRKARCMMATRAFMLVLAFAAGIVSAFASEGTNISFDGKAAIVDVGTLVRTGTRVSGSGGGILFDLPNGSQIVVTNLHIAGNFERISATSSGSTSRARLVWPQEAGCDGFECTDRDGKPVMDIAILLLDSRISATAFRISDLDKATKGPSLKNAALFGGTPDAYRRNGRESIPEGRAKSILYWFFEKNLVRGHSGSLIFTTRDDLIIVEGIVSAYVKLEEGGQKKAGSLILSSAAIANVIRGYLRSQQSAATTAPTP